jgi:hypothetical protein
VLHDTLYQCYGNNPIVGYAGFSLKLIYWNIKEKIKIDIIKDLLLSEQPQFLFLSEAGVTQIREIVDSIIDASYEYFETPGCNRVGIIKLSSVVTELMKQDSYYSMIKAFDKSGEINIVSLHLPSEMFQSMDALKSFLRRLRTDIGMQIGSSNEKEIILIGDFNVNPFESPMIGFDGFGASNGKNPRERITHLEETIFPYINPTWRLYSRENYPGTIKFNRPSGYSFDILEWHYLDQVIISKKLNDKIITDSIRVIESTSKYEYVDLVSGKINYSDHLALLYEFER